MEERRRALWETLLDICLLFWHHVDTLLGFACLFYFTLCSILSYEDIAGREICRCISMWDRLW